MQKIPSIDDLPQELFQYLLSFLDDRTLLTSSRVSRYWLSSSNTEWENRQKKLMSQYNSQKKHYFIYRKLLNGLADLYLECADNFFEMVETNKIESPSDLIHLTDCLKLSLWETGNIGHFIQREFESIADYLSSTDNSTLERAQNFLPNILVDLLPVTHLDVFKIAMKKDSSRLLRITDGFSLLHCLLATDTDAAEIIELLVHEKKLYIDEGDNLPNKITPLRVLIALKAKVGYYNVEHKNCIQRIIACGANLNHLSDEENLFLNEMKNQNVKRIPEATKEERTAKHLKV